MHAVSPLMPASLDRTPRMPLPRQRAGVFCPRPIEIDALALLIETATDVRVVVRSIDAHLPDMRRTAGRLDLMLVDETLTTEANVKKLARMNRENKLRVAVLASDASASSLLGGLPAISSTRSLVHWIEGRSNTPSVDHDNLVAVDHAAITPREREVWRLIGQGYSVRRVAERLELAESTVDSHKSRLMKKLGVHKSLELVRLAVRLGMVDP